MTDRLLRVLVLSWHYPSPAFPLSRLWVGRMVEAAATAADVQVIAPTPWALPFVGRRSRRRLGSGPRREARGNVAIHFPRVPPSVESHLHGFDARLALRPILALARQLHEAAPFDLIHAHFIYPEGVVASEIGRTLGVPVMTSEHALWTPWLVDRARVGRQVEGAMPHIRLVAAVSAFQREEIDRWARGRVDTGVLPNVLDDAVFSPAERPRDPNELLFVGMIRRVKRVDVLLRALAEARLVNPALHLRILAANAHQAYSRDLREIHELIGALQLGDAVTFVAGAEPAAVAEAMRSCAFVAVSSTRRETFCSVAAEAMACGTPLILTRCGGPEEFVTPDDGVMVAPDDPSAFAAGILQAMDMRARFDSREMSARIISRYGRAAWTRCAMGLYERLATEGAGRGRGAG